MSNIEWTEKTWNPVIGCTPVSRGCLNCYAATMANRMQHMPQVPEYAPRLVDERGITHQGAIPTERLKTLKTIRIAEVRNGRAVFTGDVRCLEERLTDPLHWKKPRMIFLNSMSDLFHDKVPFEFVDKVFAVMGLCPQHTFQILTKRPERMREYLNRPWVNMADGRRGLRDAINAAAFELTVGRHVFPTHAHGMIDGPSWPFPNVWLGTSVENQKCADERIPHLIGTHAAVRFLSCEPLLGDVDIGFPEGCRGCNHPGNIMPTWNANGRCSRCDGTRQEPSKIGWVIVGGESGNQTRPCDVEWIRSIVQQCQAARVPCFVKQLGARVWVDFYTKDPELEEWSRARERCVWNPDGMGRIGGIEAVSKWHESDGQPRSGAVIEVALRSRKGSDMSEWPEDVRVRQLPGAAEVGGGA